MALTDTAIRNAKPMKLSDAGGLQLHLMPTGSKLWRLTYRFQTKQKQFALGAYPAVSLAQARMAGAGGDAAQSLQIGNSDDREFDPVDQRLSGLNVRSRSARCRGRLRAGFCCSPRHWPVL